MDSSPSTKWSLEPLRSYSDQRGTLVSLESGRDVGFPIQRVYYLHDTPAAVDRGLHAHRTLQQLAIAISGACTFLLDDGSVREELRLDSSGSGLFMDVMVWHEMRDFSADCVLLVLASAAFDETDYIRDYDEFRRCAAGSGPQ